VTVEVAKEKLLIDLDKLKKITEFPALYLADYFDALRNRVDKECATKQLELNVNENKEAMDELWQEMITKINSFENSCIRKIYD